MGDEFGETRSHERSGLSDPEPEVACRTPGKLQQRAILRYKPVGLRSVRQFEKLLVVAIAAFRQRRGVGERRFGRNEL